MVQSTFISSQGCTEIVQRLSWSPGLSCPGPEQHCCHLAPLWTPPPPPPWGSHPVEEQSQGGQNFWSSRRLWRGSRLRTRHGFSPCPPSPPCAPWSIAGADFDWEGGEADRRWLIVEVHLHSQGGRQEGEDRRRERPADAGRRRDSEPWWLTTLVDGGSETTVADLTPARLFYLQRSWITRSREKIWPEKKHYEKSTYQVWMFSEFHSVTTCATFVTTIQTRDAVIFY